MATSKPSKSSLATSKPSESSLATSKPSETTETTGKSSRTSVATSKTSTKKSSETSVTTEKSSKTSTKKSSETLATTFATSENTSVTTLDTSKVSSSSSDSSDATSSSSSSSTSSSSGISESTLQSTRPSEKPSTKSILKKPSRAQFVNTGCAANEERKGCKLNTIRPKQSSVCQKYDTADYENYKASLFKPKTKPKCKKQKPCETDKLRWMKGNYDVLNSTVLVRNTMRNEPKLPAQPSRQNLHEPYSFEDETNALDFRPQKVFSPNLNDVFGDFFSEARINRERLHNYLDFRGIKKKNVEGYNWAKCYELDLLAMRRNSKNEKNLSIESCKFPKSNRMNLLQHRLEFNRKNLPQTEVFTSHRLQLGSPKPTEDCHTSKNDNSKNVKLNLTMKFNKNMACNLTELLKGLSRRSSSDN